MDAPSFEYTRGLENQVVTNKSTIAKLLAEVRSLELDLEIERGKHDAVIIECEAWMERACDLAVQTINS